MKKTVSAEPDWSREKPSQFWDPGRKLLASIRFYQRNNQNNNLFRIVLTKVAVIRHVFWSIVTGAEIDLACTIGGGLLLTHPNGIVIHPKVVIGCNCLIYQQVTIGTGKYGVPIIGHHVDIGAGAKVLGGITIGNYVKIGANAVVIKDVDAYSVVVGIPAKVVGHIQHEKAPSVRDK